jgi:esterase/lipase superfamily enzyme
MIAIDEILAVLRHLLAERADRVPESINAETTLAELLATEDDWLALQRGIYRNLSCFISMADLRAQRTVSDLARAVQDTTVVEPSKEVINTGEHLQLRDDEADQQLYQTVRVFYATDRAKGALRGNIQSYKPRRGDGTLALGVAEVAIPRGHDYAELESPPWWQFFRSPDPRRHITVLLASELQEGAFWHTVRDCIASSSTHDILLLIHGYNVTFDNGLRRAGQIVKDLKFGGAPVLYSWPSHGSTMMYSADEANVEWTVPHLKVFLRQLLESAGAAQVHVIAHSLGNRAAINAIRELQIETLAPNAAQLSQFVLAAPDIDADTFRQLAADFACKAKRCTLYANTEDRALAASGWKHGGYARAGGGDDELVVVQSIDTIDATGHATDFLSHSYIANSSPVISDLFYLIRSELPDERARLERCQKGELVYWRIA